MNGWMWLALILVLFGLLLASRLKVSMAYDEEGFRAAIKFGLITVFRFPGKKGKKPKEKKAGKKKPKKEKEKPDGKKKGGGIPGIREIISIIGDTLGRLRRKLRVDELTLLYCSASSDPASAALAFGGASAAAGMLIIPLERAFRIKKRDIRTAVSFTETEPTVVLRLRISLSLFGLLSMALPAILRFFKAMRKKDKDTRSHRYQS